MNAFLARTGDRLTTPAEKPKACKAEALDEQPSKDPKGMEYLIDEDCDGKGDYTVRVPDSKREPIAIYIDDDGDGKIDTLILDERQDGKPDIALYDTDGNGKPDMKGLYRNGEQEPFRFEKIKE